MNKIILLFLVLILTGCAALNPNYITQSWIGANESDLIAKWGIPDRIMNVEDGNKILVYHRTEYKWTNPGHVDTLGGGMNTDYYTVNETTTYTPPEKHGYGKNYLYWINKDGTIYKASWQPWSY